MKNRERRGWRNGCAHPLLGCGGADLSPSSRNSLSARVRPSDPLRPGAGCMENAEAAAGCDDPVGRRTNDAKKIGVSYRCWPDCSSCLPASTSSSRRRNPAGSPSGKTKAGMRTATNIGKSDARRSAHRSGHPKRHGAMERDAGGRQTGRAQFRRQDRPTARPCSCSSGGHRLAPGFRMRGYIGGKKSEQQVQMIYVECAGAEAAPGSTLTLDYTLCRRAITTITNRIRTRATAR